MLRPTLLVFVASAVLSGGTVGAASSPGAPGVDKFSASNATTEALIDELGSADPAIREAATSKLQEMGKTAIPALKRAAEADDPEVRARVRSLLRKAERRLPPAAPPVKGGGHRQSMRVTMINGQRTVDVDDNGYRIQIRQGPDGIVMDVTGVEEDKPVTETYRAKDADTLKQENPEAFALYDKYNGGRMSGRIVHGGNGLAPGPIIGRGMAGRPAVIEVLSAQIEAMEVAIAQMEQALPDQPERAAPFRERLAQLRARLADAEAQVDVQNQLRQDFERRRQQALEEMKVPLRDEAPTTRPAEPPAAPDRAEPTPK